MEETQQLAYFYDFINKVETLLHSNFIPCYNLPPVFCLYQVLISKLSEQAKEGKSFSLSGAFFSSEKSPCVQECSLHQSNLNEKVSQCCKCLTKKFSSCSYSLMLSLICIYRLYI